MHVQPKLCKNTNHSPYLKVFRPFGNGGISEYLCDRLFYVSLAGI